MIPALRAIFSRRKPQAAAPPPPVETRPPLQAAIHDFANLGWPDPRPDMLDDSTIGIIKARFNRFLAMADLPPRYRIATFDLAAEGPPLSPESCIVDIEDGSVTLRFPLGCQRTWVMIKRALSAIAAIEAMFKSSPSGNRRFHLELGDSGYATSACFSSAQPDCCLLPDPEFVATSGYATVRHMMSVPQPPWSSRKDSIFWRGSTTGHPSAPPPPGSEPDDFSWLPRLDLCRRARDSQMAGYFDIGISDIVQMPDAHIRARIAASGLMKPSVKREAFLQHKGVIVIDGNSNAWSAMFIALLTGACVLKVDSPHGFRQWYYDALIPFVHFVPIASDLHDLDERAAWTLEHDTNAAAIAAAGRTLAESMTFDSEMRAAGQRLHAWLSNRSSVAL